MKRIDRWQVAQKLVAARERFDFPAGRSGDDRFRSGSMKRFVERVREAQSELMAELYVTHYTNRQLDALLEFFESDIGQSIIAADRSINREYYETLPSRIERLQSEMKAESEAEVKGGEVRLRAHPDPDRDAS